MRDLRFIVVHHSASPRDVTLEAIREWHTEKGWADVGYHYVIEGDGTIRQGRPINQVGAHVRGQNKNSIGVCVVGDMTSRDDKWTVAQMDSLTRLLESLRLVFGGLDVVGHKDLANTECPGVDVL